MRFLFSFLLLFMVSFFAFSSSGLTSDLLNGSHVKNAFHTIEKHDFLLDGKCAEINKINSPQTPSAPLDPASPLNNAPKIDAPELSFDLELDALAYQNLNFLEGLELKNSKIATVHYKEGAVYLNDHHLNSQESSVLSNYLKKLCHH